MNDDDDDDRESHEEDLWTGVEHAYAELSLAPYVDPDPQVTTLLGEALAAIIKLRDILQERRIKAHAAKENDHVPGRPARRRR